MFYLDEFLKGKWSNAVLAISVMIVVLDFLITGIVHPLGVLMAGIAGYIFTYKILTLLETKAVRAFNQLVHKKPKK